MSRNLIVGVLGGIVCLLVFFWLIHLSFAGCGYIGHRAYRRGPGWYYFGGLRYYHGPSYRRSVRGGSVTGPDVRGGGPRGIK